MKCSYCERERDTKKINSTIWNRHVNVCKVKLKRKYTKIGHIKLFLENTYTQNYWQVLYNLNTYYNILGPILKVQGWNG